MGNYPAFDQWHKRWVQLPDSRRAVLHRVASVVAPTAEQKAQTQAEYAVMFAANGLTYPKKELDDWDADGLIPRGIQGTTACGRSGRLGMPGIFSRMGAPRCKQCCKLTGVPYGDGAPFNDETLSPELQNA